MNTSNRQTGRTTKMLEQVLEAANEGRRVLVVARDVNHCSHIISTLNSSANFNTSRNIVVAPFSDLLPEQYLRGREYDRVFVDHSIWQVDVAEELIRVKHEISRK